MDADLAQEFLVRARGAHRSRRGGGLVGGVLGFLLHETIVPPGKALCPTWGSQPRLGTTGVESGSIPIYLNIYSVLL